jgi:hypothetical protein
MQQDLPPTAKLTGTGWVSWGQITQALTGVECVWSDLEGVHAGPVPAAAPAGATHLWGWTPDELHRVRVDDGQAILATLTLRGDPGQRPSAPAGPHNSRDVRIQASPAATWAEPHVNVGPVAGRSWQTVETLSGAAMTFLRPAT